VKAGTVTGAKLSLGCASWPTRDGVTIVLKLELERVFSSAILLVNKTGDTQALTPRAFELWCRRNGFRTVERKAERLIMEREAA
jgi:hypothetical protein